MAMQIKNGRLKHLKVRKGGLPPLFLSVLICAIASVSISLRHARAQSPDELPGVAELKKGDYDSAIKLLTARLGASAADAQAEENLLRAYLETGRYAEAEAAAKKFLARTAAATGVRHQLAEVFAATGRYTEAIAEFEHAGTDAKIGRAHV